MFTDGDGHPIHPHAITPGVRADRPTAGVPVIRLHDLRHTHGTLLIKAGVPVKVVSERLGHANIAFTIETYQHVLPGMQADAARVFEASRSQLHRPRPGGTPEEHPEEHRLNPVERPDQRRRPRSLTWAFMLQLVAGAGFEPATFGL